jgi:adenylyltransferase/sulfurtransferase
LVDYEEFCGLKQPAAQEQPLEEITVAELAAQIENNPEVQIIDVREPHEFEIARIPGTKLIPLAQIVQRAKEIDPSRAAIVHCKSGVRSGKAIRALRESGYKGKLLNLKGGVLAWSDEIDPSVPKY